MKSFILFYHHFNINFKLLISNRVSLTLHGPVLCLSTTKTTCTNSATRPNSHNDGTQLSVFILLCLSLVHMVLTHENISVISQKCGRLPNNASPNATKKSMKKQVELNQYFIDNKLCGQYQNSTFQYTQYTFYINTRSIVNELHEFQSLVYRTTNPPSFKLNRCFIKCVGVNLSCKRIYIVWYVIKLWYAF